MNKYLLVFVLLYTTGPLYSQNEEGQIPRSNKSTEKTNREWILEEKTENFKKQENILSQKFDGIRIMWWNIKRGEHGKLLASKHSKNINPLEKNLITLVQSPLKPDVLIFGEYSPHAFKTEVEKYLIDHFKYTMYVDYNPNAPGFGFLIFSNLEWAGPMIYKNIDWTPTAINLTHDQKQEYRQNIINHFEKANLFFRPYLRLKFKEKNKVYNIIPVHLCQPWEEVEQEKSIVSAALASFFDTNNPLFYQLQRLTWEMKNDLGTPIDSAAVVLGDFNFPKKYFIKSVSYEYITQILKDAFTDNPASFPTPSDEKWYYPSMKIDHAFVSDSIQTLSAHVLSLRGSDHYPEYIVVK